MDAITLLKDDHKRVEKLFKRFEDAGPRAHVEKRQIVDRIIEELSVHAAIEEMLFYPVTRETVEDVHDIALESLEEHHVVKILLAELQKMDPTEERFDAKVSVLMENVRHHVEEEEGEYFPKVRSELGRNALSELGEAMKDARDTAPTRPHPMAPDEGPGVYVAGAAASVMDRTRDTVSGVAQGAVGAVQALFDRIRGVERPQPAPTGSSRTRRVARDIRDDTEAAFDKTLAAVRDAKSAGEDTVEKARSTAEDTAKAASTGAKRTAGSARRGARTTKTTAKQAATTTRNTAGETAKAASTGAKRTAGSARRGARTTKTTAKQAATSTRNAATRS